MRIGINLNLYITNGLISRSIKLPGIYHNAMVIRIGTCFGQQVPERRANDNV